MPRMSHLAAACAAVLLCLAAPASAYRLPEDLAPIPGNPADKLTSIAIDEPVYDPASRCLPRSPDKMGSPGMPTT